MALANGTDGLWFNKTSSTTSAAREFTHSRTLGNLGNQTIMSFTHSSSGGTWYNLAFWCRMAMFRNDGTANFVSAGYMKGNILWVGSGNYWEVRMNDQYGMSNQNTTLYSYVDITSSNVLRFGSNYYGAPGFNHKIIFNVFALYYRWDLITVSYS